MKAWEIWTFDPGYGDHPAVIISHPDRAANKPVVDFVLASSHRSRRPPQRGEVLLDTADGLDWETLCDCSVIHSANKADLDNLRGVVSVERRRAIVRAIVEGHGWQGL